MADKKLTETEVATANAAARAAVKASGLQKPTPINDLQEFILGGNDVIAEFIVDVPPEHDSILLLINGTASADRFTFSGSSIDGVAGVAMIVHATIWVNNIRWNDFMISRASPPIIITAGEETVYEPMAFGDRQHHDIGSLAGRCVIRIEANVMYGGFYPGGTLRAEGLHGTMTIDPQTDKREFPS